MKVFAAKQPFVGLECVVDISPVADKSCDFTSENSAATDASVMICQKVSGIVHSFWVVRY